MVKFLENLQEAEKIIRVVDKLIYSEIPVAKGKNIILKFLEELNLALTKCIESVLYYEYFTNKITLSSDKKTNLKTFMDHCASDYNITPEEKRKILQLFNLAKTHQQSPFEFKKGEKIIILSQTSIPLSRCFSAPSNNPRE